MLEKFYLVDSLFHWKPANNTRWPSSGTLEHSRLFNNRQLVVRERTKSEHYEKFISLLRVLHEKKLICYAGTKQSIH